MQTVYKSCSGINNKVDPAKLIYIKKTGITELEAATDVLIDRYGGLSSRRGSELLISGDYISAYPVGDPQSPEGFYAVKNRSTDSAIMRCVPSLSGSIVEYGIRSSLALGARMDFCYVDGKTYYMNGFEHGVLDGAISNAWSVYGYPRDTTAPTIPVTPGEHLDMLSGRFLISRGDEVQFTEPGLWGTLDNNRNWRRFESRVLMLCSVGTGAFISDSEAIYFCEGKDPNAWTLRKVLGYPAIEFCRAPGLINPSHFGFETSVPSALFGTVNGPVVGLPDGSLFNLMDKKVTMPVGCSRGAIMIVDETTIIQSGV